LVTGTGNISVAPSFTNGYHLAIGSPCINAGINESWMTSAKDLNGNPRIIGGTVDMGCYEMVPEPFYLSFIIYYLIIMKRK
jgi:hypothetical protein